jgi:S-adenosylmethionine:tRNA ribosyltransferase-isomerase
MRMGHAWVRTVLVSALMGLERMQAVYAHAIETGYRFYSYGDASLLLPGPA